MKLRHRSVHWLPIVALIVSSIAARAQEGDLPYLHIAVSDGRGGPPLVGARVSVCLPEGRPEGDAETGADGRAHVLLEGELDDAIVWVSATGREPLRLAWKSADGDLSVHLAPASRVVTGAVVDPAGAPIPGADVEVCWWPSDRAPICNRVRSHVVTDGRGRFSCGGIGSSEEVHIQVCAQKEGWLGAPPVLHGEECRIPMWPMRRVSLVVLDAGGRPVDATVMLTIAPEELASCDRQEARALAEWQYRRRALRLPAGTRDGPWLPGRRLVVQARAPRVGAMSRTVRADETEVVCVLPESHQLCVAVRDPDGNPLASAAVLLADMGARELEERLLELARDAQSRRPPVRPYVAAVTGEDGEARLVDLPPEPAEILVYHPNLGATLATWRPGQGRLEIVADGAGCGSVECTTPTGATGAGADGQPLQVALMPAHPVAGVVRWSSASPWRVSVPQGETIRFHGVLPGDYSMVCTGPGHCLSATVHVVAGATATGEFRPCGRPAR